MRKRKIILLICFGIIGISLVSCGSNVENEARVNELENELENYKKENDIYKKRLEELTKEIEKIKKESVKKDEKKDDTKSKEEKVKYSTYANSRFGFTIDYPSHFKKGSEPTNMDGLEFTYGSASLVASGINNSLGESVDKLYKDDLSGIQGEIAYKNKGSNFYVISWEENNIIYYKYLKSGAGSINNFTIKYPKNEKEKYSKVVDHIYNSFKPGDLSKSH